MTDQAHAGAAGPPPGLAEVVGWLGCEVDDVGGRRLGRVRDFYVDAERGQPSWVVIALPRRRLRFWRRRPDLVPLSVRDCAAAAGRLWTAHAREAVQAAPIVDPARPLLREHDLAICTHYGIGERVGRAAEVVGQPRGAITSQPG